MKHYFGILTLAALLLLVAGLHGALAAQPAAPQAGRPVQDKPEKGFDRVTAVSVTHEGTDSMGARLGTRLKERFNQSSLFKLDEEEEKDSPKLCLLLDTQMEFPGRPEVGSIYAVAWVFKQGKGYLGYLLARHMGTVAHDNLDALVDTLVERTDGIATKYASLWK